jgi:hypothetical protein
MHEEQSTVGNLFALRRITESAVRGRAKRMGFNVTKSRKGLSIDNHGEYMLIENNWVILGSRFDATLEDISDYLDTQ